MKCGEKTTGCDERRREEGVGGRKGLRSVFVTSLNWTINLDGGDSIEMVSRGKGS